ncbi:transketolase family protein [Nocardia takedensis]
MTERRITDGSIGFTPSMLSCVEAWSAALESAADQNPNIVVLVNDSVASSGLVRFSRRFPDRIINVGIAEQNLVSVAAGLAAAGKIAFVSSAASFLTGRALEQIKVDVAYARANVKLVGQSPGVSYGRLGPTHHAIEDISWISALPGIPVIAPVNPLETMSAVKWAAESPGAVYLRIPRTLYGDTPDEPAVFDFGRATTLQYGRDVTLVATGATAGLAVRAAQRLACDGLDCLVLCMSTVKPLDTETLLDAVGRTAGVITIEDGLVTGLGAAVAAEVVERKPTLVRRIGFRDCFGTVGSDEAILKDAGVDVDQIVIAARELCRYRSGFHEGSNSA